MQARVEWYWEFFGPKGGFNGNVLAVDPRDAVARALTSETPSGLLFGDEHEVPVDVLDRVPANADKEYTLTGDRFVLRVLRA